MVIFLLIAFIVYHCTNFLDKWSIDIAMCSCNKMKKCSVFYTYKYITVDVHVTLHIK